MSIDINIITCAELLDAEAFRARYWDSGLDHGSELFAEGFRRLLSGNPYARPDDPIAFLARLDGRVVSQIIVMPDELRIATRQGAGSREQGGRKSGGRGRRTEDGSQREERQRSEIRSRLKSVHQHDPQLVLPTLGEQPSQGTYHESQITNHGSQPSNIQHSEFNIQNSTFKSPSSAPPAPSSEHTTPIRWFWGQSFVTYPAARGKGVGTVLVERMNQELKARGICYGAYAMSPMSRRVWEKCGMRYLGRINRCAMLLDTRPLLAYLRIPQPMLRPLRAVGNLATRCMYGILGMVTGGGGKRGYGLEEVTEFDERLDAALTETQRAQRKDPEPPVPGEEGNEVTDGVGNCGAGPETSTTSPGRGTPGTTDAPPYSNSPLPRHPVTPTPRCPDTPTPPHPTAHDPQSAPGTEGSRLSAPCPPLHAPCFFHRDAASLNWRVRNTQRGSADREYISAYLNDRNGNLAGYFVLKLGTYQKFGGKSMPNLRLASLLDCRAKDDKALRALVIHAIRKARDRGGELFEAINSHRSFAAQARRLGMLRLGGYEMAFDAPEGSPVFDIAKENWWITTGESDAFFF